MLIHLHSQATATPKVRAAIRASDQAGTVLAERFGVTPQTFYMWRKRDTVEDRSRTPHRPRTTLTPAQEPHYLPGCDYLARVIKGVTFKDGIETTKTGQIPA